MLGGRAGQALKQSNPAAYYAKYVAPQLDRPGMAGAAANVERQRLLKTITNQAVNPGLDIRPSPGTAVVAMPQGVPVYGKVQAAPAPAPAPAPAAPAAPTVDYSAQIADLTKQSQEYRKQAEDIIAQGQAKIKELEDADLQRQKATELQQRLSIQAAAQSAANAARGGSAANLRIQPASQTAQMGGTQGFVRRANQFGMTRRSGSAGPVNPYEQVNV